MKFVTNWLGTVEFMYNNKIHVATKISPFKANYGQDLRMGFKRRKKGKYEAVERFVERMKRIWKKAKVALEKVQEEMRKFADRKHRECKGITWWQP